MLSSSPFNGPLCMGVGASLDFLAGEAQRAPVWMQTAGLEWLYRAAREPRRLAQRYLADAYGLARHLPAQVAANAIQPRTGSAPHIRTERQGNSFVISSHGDLRGPTLGELERHILTAFQDDRHIILNLAHTARFGLDSIGRLVHLAKMMKHCRREFCLASPPAHVTRLLQASRMSRYFTYAYNVEDALYRVRKAEIRSAPETTVGVFVPSTPARLVRVQGLKDFCGRIVSVSQAPEPVSWRNQRSTRSG